MKNIWISIGALVAALSVILGAFGAHALKETLSTQSLATFKTGVEYQFMHSIAIIICGILILQFPTLGLHRVAYLFIAGIVLFSGSLYLLATAPGVPRAIGAITPFGGLCFIAAWIWLAYLTLKA